MLVNIKKKSIPLILLNARITKKSYSKWKMIPATSNILFKSFDICFSQNKETTKYLKFLGSKKIKFIGNLKFSESKTQKNNNLDNNLKKMFKSKKIWCAASTHDAEEKICVLAHKKLKNKYSNLLTIIIPRHIQRTNDIIDEIKNLDLKVQAHSTNNKINKNTEIYLVDTYGETKSFFKICKAVFLGGSLINHGGQNPLEPARCGCKILHGPYIQNFTEIYKLLNQNNLSSKFNNVNQLVKLVDQSFKQNQNYTNKAIKLKKIGSNILDNTLADINYYL
jgi:3-deoxy-D-manno-octulosonic-acid transferase